MKFYIKTTDLENALKNATPYQETQGARIVYDELDLGLSAEYKEGSDSLDDNWDAYDEKNNKVTLTPDQLDIVYKFVKGLYDTEKKSQQDQKNQFTN